MKKRPPAHGKTSNRLRPPPARPSHRPAKRDEAERLGKGNGERRPADFEALRQQGLLHYRQGRLGEALQSFSDALLAAPTHAAAWSEYGVVHAALRRFADAVACYDRALELDPRQIDALNNKGNALVALNRPCDALASYDRALALEPGFVEALANRGGLLRELERPAEALAALDEALAIRPDYGDALVNRGNALVDLDRAEEALASYDRALAVDPATANAYGNRGNALARLGRLAEALESYAKAIAQNPRDVEAWCNRGAALRELKRYGEAVECLLQAISLSPGHARAFNNLANAFLDQKRPAEALALYDRALALEPDFVEALNNRAAALLEIDRPGEALASCERAIALEPGYAEAHGNRGVALANLDRQQESLAEYDRAIALRPDYASAYENKGIALLQLGRVAEAGGAIEAAVKLAPARAQSLYHLAATRRFERGDPFLGAMEALALDNSPLDADERTYAHFALGKAYADVEDYERSFRCFSAGAALRRRLCPYDEAEVLGRLERTRLAYAADLMGRREGRGDPSPLPVFVVGMPRSGTTLVEQILASHPAVHGAGEIADFDRAAADLGGAAARALASPEAVWRMTDEEFRLLGANYLRRIRVGAPAASRVVNKTPENFRFAGLIALALPHARILHVRRDPVDTCLSCFTTRFARNHAYTNDLAELGRHYRAYEALMGHWRAALPQGTMLEVQYEELVADPEGQGRRMLAHCGLAWDARCLDFHRNQRPVRTASLAQVRQPLYKSSVGRWRRYEAFLGPLIAALGPPIAGADGAPTAVLAA